MTQIFLSYSKQNAVAASLLAQRLEADGYSVWWDHDLAAGVEYDTTIERQLNAADKVIVLWSAASIGSRWVRSEADHAAQKNRLVPVQIEDVDVPVAFRLIHFVPMLELGRGHLMESDYANLLRTMRIETQSPQTGQPTAQLSDSKPKKNDMQSLFFGLAVTVVVILALALLVNVWRQLL